MPVYRLKMKIGVHEFEAEGSEEKVESQFQAFKELIASIPQTAEKPQDVPSDAAKAAENGNGLELDKIMQNEGRVVSLTVRAASPDDAVLLTLLGQRQYRQNNSVTGGEIKDGLRQSGQPVDRTDRVLDRLSSDDNGLVITIGQRKGRRYRLTNAGIARAQEIARALIATVP